MAPNRNLNAMKRLIDALPGVAMPVDEVARTLRHMWDMDSPGGANRLDFRASQMNLVLHFGLDTAPDEARSQFEAVIRFSQTYPCRVIALTPAEAATGEHEFEGKLFSQCYLGRHLRDLCCCEALILGYAPDRSDLLENQLSTWLESDLPVYHWLHRVPAGRVDQYYLGLLKRCRKVLFDGDVDGGRYDGIEWPDPERVVDLAMARTLPLRQHLGQFVGAFAPAELVDGLESLEFHYGEGMGRNAHHLLNWHRGALARCFARPAEVDSVVFKAAPLGADASDCCLKIRWRYRDPETYLKINYNRSRKSGLIRAALPSGRFDHALHVEPLTEEAALREALFFG
jgi:hypothetical protein